MPIIRNSIIFGDNSHAFNDWCLSLGSNNTIHRTEGAAVAVGNNITITDETSPVVIDTDILNHGIHLSEKHKETKIMIAWLLNSPQFSTFCNNMTTFRGSEVGTNVRTIFQRSRDNILDELTAEEMRVYRSCVIL